MLFNDTPLAAYAKALVRLKGKEDAIFRAVLNNRATRDLIKHLNTEEQLKKDRVDSLGDRLGTYSHVTEQISDGRKKAGEFINLHDTGDFYKTWVVEIRKGFIDIDANPFKEDTNLFNEYGEEILGLNDKYMRVLIEHAKVLYIEYYRKKLLKR